MSCLKSILSLESEIKERDFSAKYLGDSKIFDTVKGKVIKVIRDFGPQDYNNDDEVLSTYNIVKNTSYALLKNKLIININDVQIDLDQLGFELSLSDDMITNLKIIKSDIKRVITVENLTSFYTINEKDSVIIYLAGFHNHDKQSQLSKIYRSYPNAEYYHFGDIDAGGFWILVTLIEKTGIKFKPYKMGVSELASHKNKVKELTKNDKTRWNKMLSDKRFELYRDVILYMLQNNIKLEQEVL